MTGKSPRLSVYLDAEVREIEFGRTWGDEMLMGIKLRRKCFAKEEVCFDQGLFRVCSRSKIDGHGHVLPGRRVSQILERVLLGSEPGGGSLKTSKSSLSPRAEPRERLRANPTDPILSRLANPGLILAVRVEWAVEIRIRSLREEL